MNSIESVQFEINETAELLNVEAMEAVRLACEIEESESTVGVETHGGGWPPS